MAAATKIRHASTLDGVYDSSTTLTDMFSLCSRRARVFRVCFSKGIFRSSNSDQIDSLSSPEITAGKPKRYDRCSLGLGLARRGAAG